MNPAMILMNPAEESVENIISNDQNFKMINYKEKNENFHSSKFLELSKPLNKESLINCNFSKILTKTDFFPPQNDNGSKRPYSK